MNFFAEKIQLEDEKPDPESKEMLSFLWIMRSWLLECTAHGIPKVIASANFHRKIFWLMAVFLSGSIFIYQITDMLLDVFEYPAPNL